MVRSSATRQVGGLASGPAPLAAVAVTSPAAHPATGSRALSWVLRSADRTNAPPPCGLTYKGLSSAPSRRGLWLAAARRVWWGGAWALLPWQMLLWTPPAAHPVSGTPLCSVLGWVSCLLTVLTPRPFMG